MVENIFLLNMTFAWQLGNNKSCFLSEVLVSVLLGTEHRDMCRGDAGIKWFALLLINMVSGHLSSFIFCFIIQVFMSYVLCSWIINYEDAH